jgi:hypothetical protein
MPSHPLTLRDARPCRISFHGRDKAAGTQAKRQKRNRAKVTPFTPSPFTIPVLLRDISSSPYTGLTPSAPAEVPPRHLTGSLGPIRGQAVHSANHNANNLSKNGVRRGSGSGSGSGVSSGAKPESNCARNKPSSMIGSF